MDVGSDGFDGDGVVHDGITVDGELFGDDDGCASTVDLSSDEFVHGMQFGYHTHRLGIQFEGTLGASEILKLVLT